MRIRVQGTESLPSWQGVCPQHGWPGSGPTKLEYAHAQIFVGKATFIRAFARSDSQNRLATQVLSDQPVTGDVRVKIAHIAVCETKEIDTEFTTSDVDLFVDLDLPFKIQFVKTKDARLSMDKTAFLMYIPSWNPNDPQDKQRMVISFGEQLTDGTWLPGANWVWHESSFNPEGPGEWVLSFAGGHQVDILHAPDGNDPGFYHHSTSNTLSTQLDPTWCCQTGDKKGKYFLIDLFWDKDIRDDMFCRDNDDGCYIPFPGTPGHDFFKAIYDLGHLTLDGPVEFGELQTLSSVPSMTGTIPGSPYWQQPVDESSLDPELAKWVFHTAPVLTGFDGTTYEIWLGVGDLEKAIDDPEKSDTEVTLVARYANGVGRWQRQIGYKDAPCGVLWSCKVEGTMTLLPSGHMLVSYTLFSAQGQWKDEGGGTVLFDPSGIGGTPSQAESCAPASPPTCMADVQAAAGNPVTLDQVLTNDAGANGVVTGHDLKKVWYFGDGDVLDQGTSKGKAKPAEHMYPFAGVYPATLVYYGFYDPTHEWVPIVTIAQQVTVS
jgi:hypothetical protein